MIANIYENFVFYLFEKKIIKILNFRKVINILHKINNV